MNKATRTALEKSITRWRELARRKLVRNLDLGPHQCPLCRRFLLVTTQACVGCPVRRRTGRLYCAGSPYEAAHSALVWNHPDARVTPELRKAMEAELAFLISLRPNTKKEKQ